MTPRYEYTHSATPMPSLVVCGTYQKDQHNETMSHWQNEILHAVQHTQQYRHSSVVGA